MCASRPRPLTDSLKTELRTQAPFPALGGVVRDQSLRCEALKKAKKA